ncbi:MULTISPECIES: DUF368 domain-containing protein [Bacteroidales]|uniref:DUF368 domain-containing protein n=1 Tax=Bacteroidales TaxID=171549 RepID=UPI0006D7ADB7|nr:MULTISPECIES: DUF368 domain-containing protein [Bacteroidales]
MRKSKDYLLLALKGMGMGAADVVPGVSGGTIAFIVGIYEELIDSIKSINLKTIKLFFTLRWVAFFKAINGSFLFSVLAGILISVFSLAKLITWLLETHPILVWSFFFGLVLASTYFVSKQIEIWDWKRWLSFVIGVGTAYYITIATPAQTPDSLLFIFMCGSIAICAMILPGISGSFILLLMGKYEFIMNAVKSLDIVIIVIFAVGAAIGLILFSNVLSYLLKNFHDITISVLSGFMLGSLNKVWPWKETIQTFTDSHGNIKPLIEQNVLPNEYLWQAILLMIMGFLMVYIIEKISGKKEKHE